MEKFKKAAECPVITLHKLTRVTPPTRLLLAPAIKLRTLVLEHSAEIQVMQELRLISLLQSRRVAPKLAYQLNYCNENVTLETSGLFLQPTLLSLLKI